MLSESLKKFHDAVLVVTAPGFADRQEHITRELSEGNFEFIYGVNKSETSKEQLTAEGLYDEARAIKLDRSSKPMTLGHICCSLGHAKTYRHMIENNVERALIFEDDASILSVDESQIENIVRSIPADAELIYWGWSGVERRPRLGGLKQTLYKIQHRIGVLKYNPTMIENLYPSDFDEHFMIAGKHFGAYAYTITLKAAERLVAWNTPVALNADNALIYAVLNGDVQGYVSRTRLFGEHSQGSADRIETLTSS